ncbi:MAG: hypothetical protein AMXMBFR23_20220 [Chloroflexota bacterium]
MMLAIVLGVIVGVAGSALVSQWLRGDLAMREGVREALRPAEFPRLARPERPYTALRRRAA